MPERNRRRDLIAQTDNGDTDAPMSEPTDVERPWAYGPVPDSAAWDSGATCGVGGCEKPAVARLSPAIADAALTRDTTRYRCRDCLEGDLNRADRGVDGE